jgi:hypothetical protein
VSKLKKLRQSLDEKQQLMQNVDATSFHNLERDNSLYESFVDSLQLDKWMTKPILLSENDPICKRVGFWLEERLPTIERTVNEIGVGGNIFITGGQICQLAFEKTWDSDVDVFIASHDERRSSYSIGDMSIDVVFCDVSSPEKVLRRFDISLCQVGVLIDVAKNNFVVYVTPLFLCSRLYNIFAIQVSDLSCSYAIVQRKSGRRIKKHVEDRFMKHTLFHVLDDDMKDFLECERCRLPLVPPSWNEEIIDKEGHFFRWAKRVAKYQHRFPNFQKQYFVARKFPGEQKQKRAKLTENE